jgi:flagellar capping protein FliD
MEIYKPIIPYLSDPACDEIIKTSGLSAEFRQVLTNMRIGEGITKVEDVKQEMTAVVEGLKKDIEELKKTVSLLVKRIEAQEAEIKEIKAANVPVEYD